ncbi:hypothetical protein SSTU70S_02821 [Stutzerimonas stutzeri]
MLKGVQPSLIPFDQITIRIGANWIPPEEIRHFTSHLMNATITEADMRVRYTPTAGIWTVDVSPAFKRNHESQRVAIYGTKNLAFEQLLEKLLNSQRPSHYNKIDGKSVLDEEATLASRTKQDELNEKFYEWVAQDSERVDRFTALYNETTNVMRVPTPDGSRLTFPGLSPTWTPRPHQKDMVAMSMLGYNTMAAHGVGAGKTWEMVAIAMKLGQLGMAKKPLIAVPNHMLGQITREAKTMYPAARILMVTGEDLKGSRRKRFLAVARNNTWDIVVCTHSLLNQISAPLPVLLREHERQINVLNSKIAESDNARTERQLTAQLKSARSRMDQVITQFEESEKRNGVLTIDQLGIDLIQVDEAHLYKNLAVNSSMNVLAQIDQACSGGLDDALEEVPLAQAACSTQPDHEANRE